MTPEEHEFVEFKLRYLKRPEVTGELSDSDLEWAIKMDDAYADQGYLTERQMEIVDGLWERAQ